MCILCYLEHDLSDSFFTINTSTNHIDSSDKTVLKDIFDNDTDSDQSIDISSIDLKKEHVLMSEKEIQDIKKGIGSNSFYDIYISDGTDNVFIYSSEYRKEVLTQTSYPTWVHMKGPLV